MNRPLFMRKLPVYVLIALLILAVVDVALSFFETALAKEAYEHPSYTISDSKARGAFLEPVTVTPSVINWRGQPIVFKEAWLEHRTELVGIYVIIPCILRHYHYRKVSGYNVCFNLTDGWDLLWSEAGPYFAVNGKQGSFSMRGTVVIWARLDSLNQFPSKILLTDNWKLENAHILAFKRAAD